MVYQIDEVLLTISYQNDGDWERMFKMIKNKTPLDKDCLARAKDNLKAQFTHVLKADYPDCFRKTEKPPISLYYYGDLKLLAKPLIAVVGSRHPTLYQVKKTQELLDEFFKKTENKYGLISGLAKGIDQAAMEVAIKNKAKLVGILGSGIENCYPQSNQHIYDYCKENGLILSEYPDKVEPLPEHFPLRNRLIAYAAKCMFVPSGTIRSGTSSSIRLALDAGKDILALPCDLGENDLTDQLIHDGAICLTGVDDLIQAMEQ